jgi:hypothetical protein
MRTRTVIAALAFVGVAACAGVLGLRRPASEPVFPHRAHTTAGVACVSCHQDIDRAGDEGPLHLPEAATCLTCHEQPHDTRDCLDCHSDPFAAASVIDARAHLRFAHADHDKASQGGCIACHRGIAEGDGPLRPTMATCFRCHDEERDERSCDACHVDLVEEGTLPASHLAHDGDWMREHGARASSSGDLCSSCHQEKFCASCHGVTAAALPSTLRFDDPGVASVHRAGFASRHSIEARAEPGACTTCHAPSACQSCHQDSGVADAPERQGSPHGPNWVGLTLDANQHGRAARRDPAECASCHSGAGEQLCVDCHRVGGVGGSIHPPGWSSTQSYADLPCRLCHTSTL